jgi:hypothetical protein
VAAAVGVGVQRCPGKLAAAAEGEVEGAGGGAEVVVVAAAAAAHHQPRVVRQTALAGAVYVWKQSVY